MRRSTKTSFKTYSLYHGADGRGSRPVLTPIATVYCCFNSHVNREQRSEWRMVLIMTFFFNFFFSVMLLKADLTVPHRSPVPNQFAGPIGKMRFGAEDNLIINTFGLLSAGWEADPRLPGISAAVILRRSEEQGECWAEGKIARR